MGLLLSTYLAWSGLDCINSLPLSGAFPELHRLERMLSAVVGNATVELKRLHLKVVCACRSDDSTRTALVDQETWATHSRKRFNVNKQTAPTQHHSARATVDSLL